MDKSKSKKKLSSVLSKVGRKRKSTIKRFEVQQENESDDASKGFADIEGVVPVSLPRETQESLKCTIGVECTLESPWVSIYKTAIKEDMDLNGFESPFYDLYELLDKYPEDDIFIGWNVLEEGSDEFFVCTTLSSKQTVQQILESQKLYHEERLANSVFKTIRPWKDLGTEVWLEESRLVDTRRPVQVIISTERQKERPKKVEFVADDGELADEDFSFSFPPDEKLKEEMVIRERCETMSQITPEMKDVGVQTLSSYPYSSWTQYEYKVDMERKIEGDVLERLDQFLDNRSKEMEDILDYNSAFNLYRDDYRDLVHDVRDTYVPDIITFEEHERFVDVRYCKNKVITGVAWHPNLTGVVAISYAENLRCNYAHPGTYDTEDLCPFNEVQDTVYGHHMVLIWSFVDRFLPKLCLESPREVHSLTFCPFDGDILVGGLVNGQIVLWDLKDCLKRVETQEKLCCRARQCRDAMMKHLEFMKPAPPPSIVPATVVSSLEFSQQACVTQVQWLSGYWKVTNKGKFEVNEEEDAPTMNFMTSAEDGTVAFWDLDAKQSAQVGMFRPRQRQGRRGRKRPPSLDADQSPYKPINRIIRPQFVICNTEPVMSISYERTYTIYFREMMASSFADVSLSRVNIRAESTDDITNRILYRAMTERPDDDPPMAITIGSICGSVSRVSWTGIEARTEKVINKQDCGIEWIGEVHSGPISCLVRSPFLREVIISVGGNEWAIWYEGDDDIPPATDGSALSPVIWKKCSSEPTFVTWSEYRPSMFLLTLYEGSMEVWDLLVRSDNPILKQSVSGHVLTGIYNQKLTMMKNVTGLADYTGTFRVLFIPPAYERSNSDDAERFRRLLKKEVMIRERNAAWSAEMHDLHAAQRAKQEEELKAEKEEQIRLEMLAASEAKTSPKKDEKKMLKDAELKILVKMRRRTEVRPTDWEQRADEAWRSRQERRMFRALLDKSRINRAQLEEAMKPLQMIREQEEVKRAKKRERERHKYKVLSETLHELFPELTMRDEDAKKESMEQSKGLDQQLNVLKPYFITDYEESEAHALTYIKENPFVSGVNLLNLLSEGEERRLLIWPLPTRTTGESSSPEQSQQMQSASGVRRIQSEIKDEDSVSDEGDTTESEIKQEFLFVEEVEGSEESSVSV